MGSPDFAVPVLRGLAAEYEVNGVVTQPDRPAGRKNIVTPPPVKIAAAELGLRIFQPEKLNRPEVFEIIQGLNPDLIVVAAYGQILRNNILDLPKYGCLNVHSSLLPRWRGAAPIFAAILHGDEFSGITIMKMDAGIDTGEFLVQEKIKIKQSETQLTLGAALAELGSSLLVKTIPDYISGMIQLIHQDSSLATYSLQLKKEDGRLDFSKPAIDLERQVRACDPWPGAYFDYESSVIKVWESKVNPDVTLPPGKRGIKNRIPVIGTSEGSLEILQLQPPGKTRMTGEQFLNGARDWKNP